MRLLVDENLPPRLVRELADLFPGSVHLSRVRLDSPDATRMARSEGFALLTRDKDLANLSMALGAPPKVILLQTGNCSAVSIIRIVRDNAGRFSEFEKDVKRSLLVLR